MEPIEASKLAWKIGLLGQSFFGPFWPLFDPCLASLPPVGQAFIGYFYFSKPIDQIPPFKYIEITGKTHFTNKNLARGSKKIFIYFSPTCESCGGLIEYFRVNNNKFIDSQILMVSTRPITSLQEFMIENNIAEMKNITILHDSTRKFVEDFRLGSFIKLPTIFVFDTNNTLIYKGDETDFIKQ